MISRIIIIDNESSFKAVLNRIGLEFKECWSRYVWINKTNYYRLVIFDNGEYGLFTQSQLPIVERHQELNSTNWADYKPYADKGYKEMRPCGVESGTKVDESWTSIRKAEFRKTDAWKNFKKNIYYWSTCHNGMIICEDCKKYYTQENIDVHHIFPDKYDELERNKFMLLCKNCHSIRTKNGE